MMKTNVMIWMGVALATVTMAQEPKVEPEVVLKAKVDRADALYEVGETVMFRIEGTLGGKAAEGGVVECVISKEGVEAGAVGGTREGQAGQGKKRAAGTSFIHPSIHTPHSPIHNFV